jgi:hypothetical protein
MNWPPQATRSSYIPRGKNAVMRGAGRPLFIPLCLGACLAAALPRAGVAQQAGSEAPVTTAEIVRQLVSRNEQRAQQLGSYTSRRHYHLSYHGFPHAAEADMVVDVTFDPPSSKHFAVVSESGPHLLVDHVLRKLLSTEQDSSRDRSDSALTPANYTFALVRTETDEGRPTYVLRVEPKAPRALLYRGTIWVDAQDYAVVKVEAQPAKNPSFWIRNTEIHHLYSKTGDFWLAQSNRTETKVRLGGVAVLTIEYGDYRFSQAAGMQPVSAANANADSTPLH